MKMLVAVALLWAPLAAGALAQTNPLCTQIQALTVASPAHWGVSVATLDGAPICALDAAKLFRPASNNKLLTIAAAIAILGPDHTFETKVTGNFNARTGVVTGDLTLLGGGDANLDSGDLPYNPHAAEPAPAFAFRDLDDLAAQLVAKGVASVTGDVVGDDSFFPYQPYVSSWELEDVVGNDGPPVSALTIADNQFQLTVTPGKTVANPAEAANVALDEHGIPFYTVQAFVHTVRDKELGGIQIQRNPGSRNLSVYGEKRAGSAPDVEEVSIDDPALYAAMAFRKALAAHGIQVHGASRSQHSPPLFNGARFLEQLRAPLDREEAIVRHEPLVLGCLIRPQGTILAIHRSAPLAADIVYTAKVSQNLHAELLLKLLDSPDPCGGESTLEGARLVRAFLLQAGVAPEDFLLYDGSGLSSHDLVAPRALTQLLAYAATQTWFAEFKAALPIGGVDGSLRSRFSGQDEPQLKGKVFAKTGSLGESRALSGYVVAASGQTLVFSLMDDNHPPSDPADRILMDHVLALIAATE